ncbi:MAG: protein kinase [Verrucomicrobiales bacterium]|nr:protein kinase [Verrucomicrobiales bacterium]
MPGPADGPIPDIPDYAMLRVIGRGNYGDVWLARNLTGQYRAVKVVWRHRFPDHGPFDREFRGLKQFASASLEARRQLALLHVGTQPEHGFFYYVMELADDVAGGRDIRPDDYVACTLRELRTRQGRLEAEVVIRLGTEIAEALDELHRRGLVHRDIKPSNIILVGGVPKLADVGLVAAIDEARTEIGTPGYMPPEGPGSPAADVFATGKVLYELATGLDRHEFPRLPDGLATFTDRARLLELNAVLLRACERDSLKRYPNAAALLTDLRLLEAGGSIQRLRSAERRSRRAIKALSIALPLALGAAVVAWRENRLRSDRDLALYRANLDQAVINVERGRSGPAHRALQGAAAFQGRGIEFELVSRQTEGDTGVAVPFRDMAVDDLKFSADAGRLAVLGSEYHQAIFSMRDRQVVTHIPDVVLLAGFLGATGDSFAGTSRQPVPGHDEVHRPMRTWSSTSGNPLDAVFAVGDGQNWPVRVLNDAATVAFMNRGRPGEVGFWQPFATNASMTWRRWGAPPPDSRPWLRALDAAGNRFLHVAESGTGASFRSHGFWFDFEYRNQGAWTDSNTVSALAMAEDGSQAAVAIHQTGEIQAGPWDARGWVPIHRRSQGETLALGYSRDGRRLASTGEDEWIRIHDTHSFSLVNSLQGLRAPVTSLAWGPGNSWLAAGDRAGNVRLWPMESDDPLDDVWTGFPGSGAPLQLAASPDGAWIAVPESATTVAIHPARHLSLRTLSVAGFSPLAFSTDGASLWTLGAQGKVTEFDRATGRALRAFETRSAESPSSVFGAASPDARYALICAGQQVSTWDLTQARRTGGGIAHDDPIVDAAVSDQSHRALTVSVDGAVLWDLRDGTPRRLDGVLEPVFSATFLDRDRRAVLGTDAGTLIEIDVTRATVKGVHRSPLQRNYQLLSTADGRRIVAGGSNGRIAILNAADFVPLVTLGHFGLQRRPGEHTVRRLAWVPGQTRLLGLTEDGLLVRW